MKIINLGDREKLNSSKRWYEGKGGKKLGIVLDGKNFLIKYPGNIKNRKENVEIDYNNAPISEYIGSKIYEMLNVDVHNTLLATIKDKEKEKTVVLCEDFLGKNERLVTFNSLKISAFENDVLDDMTNGTGCHLSSILKVLRNDPYVSKIDNIEKRFWQMFFIDFFIGNPDRHNGNWGIIINEKGNVRLAPVYDNGNCLYNLNSDRQLAELLKENIIDYEFKTMKGSFLDDNGNCLNVYDYMCVSNDKLLKDVIKELTPKIDINKIKDLINDIPLISKERKDFYINVLNGRLEKCIKPL